MATLAATPALDGMIDYFGTPYLQSRAGTTTLDVASTAVDDGFIGQWNQPANGFFCSTAYLSFDTSSLTALATITSAILSVYFVDAAAADAAFTLRARLYDWGASIAAGDWVPGASFAANTLLAHLASTSQTSSGRINFVDDAMIANVNKTGFTRMVINTDRFESGTKPASGAYEKSWFYFLPTGVSFAPTLTINYTVPGGTSRSQLIF